MKMGNLCATINNNEIILNLEDERILKYKNKFCQLHRTIYVYVFK